MTPGQSVDEDEVAARDWPEFDLVPTYNPTFLPASVHTDSDEVVVYDSTDPRGGSDRWIAADRDSHLPLPDCR